MSRYSYIVAVLIAVFFQACSIKSANKTQIFNTPSSQKLFEEEDMLILQALDLKNQKRFDESQSIFEYLYDRTKRVDYIVEAIKVSLIKRDFENAKTLIDKALKRYPDHIWINRFLIGYYLDKKDFQKAKEIALRLIKIDKNERNYEIAAAAYIGLKEYDLALKYYQSAYRQNYNEDILNKMVTILYKYLNKKDEALSYLETHSRMQGCSYKVCSRLLEIYGKQKNIDGLVSTYKKLYEKFKNIEFAKKAVELLLYQKNRYGAVKFLKESGHDDRLLLDIYVSQKDYKNAFLVSQKLYKQTDDILFLAKMAIFEYEDAKDKKDSALLKSVTQKFEKVIKQITDPLYLNYYGYLLIDHDIDVQKGIKLVKKALEIEPESPYYLDSLAWGYYKQKRCKEAFEIMKKVIDLLKEEEVNTHFHLIEKCVKEEK
jgi:tetratricopeptide (TPR) repeat protein